MHKDLERHSHECTGQEMRHFAELRVALAEHHVKYHDIPDQTIEMNCANILALFLANPEELQLLIDTVFERRGVV